MDWFTVIALAVAFAAGAGLMWWPMSLRADRLRDEIERWKKKAETAKGLVAVERSIADARDLSPADELGLLLGEDRGQEPPAPGDGSGGLQ